MPKRMYELVIRGPVPDGIRCLVDSFDVLHVQDGDTTMRGWVIDQSHLHGILDRVTALGLDVAKVWPVDVHRGAG